MEEGPRPKRSRRRLLGCVITGSLLALLLICFTPLGIPFIWGPRLWWANRQNLSEYERHRDRYDAIVNNLSGMKLDPGRGYRFLISHDLDPTTLRDAESSEERSILVFREPDGLLMAMFPTRDFGHLGCYWLYYSNQPVQLNFGEKATQVAPNWWAVYNPNG